MIVNRVTIPLKVGKTQEFLALLAEDNQRFKPPHAYRVYTSNIGTSDTVCIEWEFENLSEYEPWRENWLPTAESQAFMQKSNELIEHGGTREIWNLLYRLGCWALSFSESSKPQFCLMGNCLI